MFILKQVVVEKNVKQTIMMTEKAGEAEIYTKFHDLLIKTGSVAWSNLIFLLCAEAGNYIIVIMFNSSNEFCLWRIFFKGIEI